MPAELVGRDDEIAALDRFLDGISHRSAALLVQGEPGIGKTALWFEARSRAEVLDVAVLSARPAEADARSAWSGLDDLMSAVPETAIASLPQPQRVALEVALLRTAGLGVPPEPRAVCVAFRSVVTALAAESAVLVAIDDGQWLDSSSARAVGFLARRLPTSNVGIVVSVRAGATGERTPLDLEAGDHRFERLTLGRLSEPDVYQLARGRLGATLSRPLLRRIYLTSGGNPLFALELARALTSSSRATPAPGQPLGVPETLRDLVAGRIAAVAGTGLETLVGVAASSRATVGLLAAAGLDGGLSDCELAGLVEVSGRRVTFTHPLLAAMAYDAADSGLRRSVHRRLAAASDDIEERARHLALAATGADPAVAAALDAAATAALARGAPEHACELARLALDLGPTTGPEHWRRRLVLGEQLFRAGESRLARDHLEAARANAPTNHERARAAKALAEVAYETGAPTEAVALAEDALNRAGDDAALVAGIHTTLSHVLYDDNVRSAEHARLAVAAMERQPHPDPGLLAAALVAAAEADFMLGRGLDRSAYERAQALEAQTVPPRIRARAVACLAVNLKYADDLDAARRALLAVWKMADEEGDEGSLPFALSHLPQLELWAGHWDLAESYARQHLDLAERTGQGQQQKQAEFNLALLAAHRGDGETARRVGDALVAEGVAQASPWAERTGHNLLGFVEFCAGSHPDAARHFDLAGALTAAVGLGEPGLRRWVPYHVESHLAAGRRDRAEALLADYESRGRELGRVSALGGSARCRALLAAADGDHAAAYAALAESVDHFARGGFPFDLARTRLVEGRLRRRAREKRAAKDALQAALDLFERLGAQGFAEQANAELSRIGLRPPAPRDLTATERRVAELIGAGMSTRAVADTLFLSPKTVEANLTRIYRKLAIGSRAELGAWLQHNPPPAADRV